ncbi:MULTISPECIES: NADAR family protein [Enterococcus]|uniref:NADAR family protein n=1 Tax=Enterococcus TaxID=1350 RepID=UPI000A3D29F0|nr:NADAR family protein [Enterococcus sp. 4E1_DIV0656]OTO09176.1 hypothetical protein A5882_003506 [Enterococcus sp. 4E1_DIV0656]
MSDYVFFWGHTGDGKSLGKEVFSQWFPASFQADGRIFSTTEQWMMFQKAVLFKDNHTASLILREPDPKKIKALGRKVKNFDEKTWDKYKYAIVLKGNYLKFTQNRKLLQVLLSYEGKTFVEASPYDKVWGIGLRATDKRALTETTWQGENLLGKALTKIANDLKDMY